jgi:hypothetical protein
MPVLCSEERTTVSANTETQAEGTSGAHPVEVESDDAPAAVDNGPTLRPLQLSAVNRPALKIHRVTASWFGMPLALIAEVDK